MNFRQRGPLLPNESFQNLNLFLNSRLLLHRRLLRQVMQTQMWHRSKAQPLPRSWHPLMSLLQCRHQGPMLRPRLIHCSTLHKQTVTITSPMA